VTSQWDENVSLRITEIKREQMYRGSGTRCRIASRLNMQQHVHSPDGSTFLHKVQSWPPFWKCCIKFKVWLLQLMYIYLKNIPANLKRWSLRLLHESSSSSSYIRLNDITAAILKVWRHIRNPTLCHLIYICFKNNPVKFHPDPIWNDRGLGIFEDVHPNNKKNNDNMGSVRGPKSIRI